MIRGFARRAFLAGSLGAVALPYSRAYATDLSRVTLRVATFRGQDNTLLPAAGVADFPYRVEYSEFNSGSLISRAIDADAIDLGGWSEIPMVFAAASGARVSIVATLDGPTTNQAVVVPANSTAHSIADLRGKKVGYIRSTTAHYFLIRMLQQQGMTMHDIMPVPLGMSDGLTALKSGSLDAWATYGYAIQFLQADGSARILQSAADILSGHYFIGANPRKLGDANFRAAAADYINRLGRAYAILGADKPRWARAAAPVTHVPEPVVLEYLNGTNRPYRTRPALLHNSVYWRDEAAIEFSITRPRV
ncbi:ABC transporter substrate-binding protein [Kozakia baliensis]|uniref:ABC transporter substrate-binding protein n=1 Tax=Kozakia baliensis TaxID=153496 RepID=UPI00087CC074|nr:ABC transporter substrate-binding protein [Kozakia baliensis]AOX20062.1 ABC transporter aliphatic sulfonate-binding protein [Kozakia baliensis]